MAQKQTYSPGARRRVALIVETSMASGRELVRGFAEYVRQAEHWAIYHEPGHLLTTLPDWLEAWQGDGIVARIRNKIVAQKLLKMRVPVVDVTGIVPDTGIPIVTSNSQAIGKLAAGHLLEHGFRQFAFCGIRGAAWSQIRREVFRETIARSGYAAHQYMLPSVGGKNWFSEKERDSLAQWIAALPKPIGIMAANDWAGQKVLAACRRIGVMVPEDAAVIGVDNDEAICEICDPMLTSIIARHDRVGYYAAELLDRLMQGKPAPTEPMAVGEPTIVVRRSTDVQTLDDRDIAEAVRFIRENACSQISVGEVASHVALSRTTLKRRFQQVLSRSVHDEIVRVRISRAKELLTETSMSLAQIAQATGFQHQEYLGVVFKSAIGMTPGQFRMENTRKPC